MCCFQGVWVMSYICFLPDTKNLHKIPKIVHSTVGGLHRRFFRVFINTQVRQKSVSRRVQQKKIVNFDKMSNFFWQSFFRNFFVHIFFSEFFWKAKLTIFGKNNVFRPFQVFTKNSPFFFRKNRDFFRFFSEKKICKKTQKNVILQKVCRSISGEIAKSAKKNMRKKWIFAFLNPLQKW